MANVYINDVISHSAPLLQCLYSSMHLHISLTAFQCLNINNTKPLLAPYLSTVRSGPGLVSGSSGSIVTWVHLKDHFTQLANTFIYLPLLVSKFYQLKILRYPPLRFLPLS